MRNLLLIGLFILACSFYTLEDTTNKLKLWHTEETTFQMSMLGENNGNSGRGFHYQAVIRDNDGAPKASENVELQFSLIPEIGLQATWQETQMSTTSAFGVFSVTIGKGIKSGGTAAEYKDVDFGAHDYWLKVELKENGSWVELGTSKIPSAPYAEVATKAQNVAGIPVGSIMPFAGPKENIPEGWKLCDGSLLSRTENTALYSAIGTAWGAGNGTTTFHIPDLRSMFLRGVDHGRALDPDRGDRGPMRAGGNTNDKVGSFQYHRLAAHKHTGETNAAGHHEHLVENRPYTGGGYPLFWQSPSRSGDHSGYTHDMIDASHPHFDNPSRKGGTVHARGAGTHKHTFTTHLSGGNETRPVNAYVNYIIKL